jgi:hypothetical protein
MLVEDEDDIILLFKMILESNVGLRVDSFNEPFAALSAIYTVCLIFLPSGIKLVPVRRGLLILGFGKQLMSQDERQGIWFVGL